MNWQPDDRYRVENIGEVDSPALLVFPAVIESNIDRALELTATYGGHCLQPHIKTVKTLEIARMAIDRGITRFKCSTVSEGELLGQAGAERVLLSYQLSDVKARRWQRLRDSFPGTEFSALIDNPDTARMLSGRFAERPLNVYVDVNPGMDRTGIRPDDVPELLQIIHELPGLELRGFHVYDGHLRDPDESARREQAGALFAKVESLRLPAETQYVRELEVVVAGSPNFPFYVGKRNTWVSPGTFFLWDAGYGDSFANWGFEPAALVLSRIISVVTDKKFCLDMGSKAVAPDKAQPRMYFPGIGEYAVEGQWEEHLVIRVPDTSSYRVGEPFFAVPAHVCTTVNLYEELLPVTHGRVEEGWRVVARDRRITI
ncbi:alanine racemase [Lewinella sp. IMCC34183]|uniref:alanine racemase n=1 Tax=Lewinella sp. IMCC34183 TaxID=2248762 RepID=UPI000E24B94C|nr:alanine racemase [Lewinella sp. IMCC34183]